MQEMVENNTPPRPSGLRRCLDLFGFTHPRAKIGCVGCVEACGVVAADIESPRFFGLHRCVGLFGFTDPRALAAYIAPFLYMGGGERCCVEACGVFARER